MQAVTYHVIPDQYMLLNLHRELSLTMIHLISAKAVRIFDLKALRGLKNCKIVSYLSNTHSLATFLGISVQLLVNTKISTFKHVDTVKMTWKFKLTSKFLKSSFTLSEAWLLVPEKLV